MTNVRVLPRPLTCQQGGSFGNDGCACGGSDADSAGGGRQSVADDPPVTVVHEGTVGPYETVTLRSEDPQALRTWLTSGGYTIPSDIESVIDAYVSEGMDFIALRLSPGKGVQQMTPVRVVTPKGPGVLPLRMVAAGVGDEVAITLYVIAEGRYGMPDLGEQRVDPKDLVYDWLDSTSNYASLRERALARNDRRTYLTSFAVDNAFATTIDRPDFGVAQYATSDRPGFGQYSTLGELYFAQAAVNDVSSASCAAQVSLLESPALVVENCPPDGGVCADTGSDELSSRQFECEGWTDVAAAMIGMHPRETWVTRLDLDLPRTALDMDCVVEPSADQTEVNNWLLAEQHDNPPCEPSVFTSSLDARTRRELPGMLAYGAVFGAWLGRRRRGARREAVGRSLG